ncbi:MAG: tryptophan synthase subunit alpha [Armatimonadota bacterium]|nr:tryptophan synthase subunit alpha [Armatimonadota bacterium]MDR7403548.1 tryptophan synthase subunit alpha [Armatimonadota bacterium]MDR7508247.1 tryptophan synthase subunit alpha [Armatimonadota bacterium]
MSRLASVFAGLHRPALIPFLMAGDPDPERCIPLLRAAARAGDILEVGIPFSDPIADGPTIQRAGGRALRAGVTVAAALEIVRQVRQTADTPVVVLTYANPLLQFGVDRFCARARAAGVDGVVVPDLPVDEADLLIGSARRADLDTIFLVAPTTSDARLALAARHSRSFLYCVSLTGVTGARDALPPEAEALVRRARAVTSLPVCVGFGIATPQQAQALGRVADGVIVGSALVEAAERATDPVGAVEDLLGRLRGSLAAVSRGGPPLSGPAPPPDATG